MVATNSLATCSWQASSISHSTAPKSPTPTQVRSPTIATTTAVASPFRSPRSKAGGLAFGPDTKCMHESLTAFFSCDNKSFFTDKYYEQHDNVPKQCSMCEAKFVSKGAAVLDEETKKFKQYPVSVANPCHGCYHAWRNESPCDYALCKLCHKEVVEANSPHRGKGVAGRKRTRGASLVSKARGVSAAIMAKKPRA